MPMTYGVDALRAIMLRGANLAAVGFDLAILCPILHPGRRQFPQEARVSTFCLQDSRYFECVQHFEGARFSNIAQNAS